MNRYLVQSSLAHAALLAVIIWNPFFRSNDVIWLTPEFFGDGGGGDGRAGRGSGSGGTGITKTGPKAQEIGQVVPKPVQVVVPQKAGPIQKEMKGQETWAVKNIEKSNPTPQTIPKTAGEPENIQRGDKVQKEQTNIIRRGVAEGTVAGAGGFDFGVEGPGIGIDSTGDGRGIGHGEGVGSGTGSGFGFGGYLKQLRRRIWQEWSQSAVYGHKESCVVGLTVLASGQVKDVKVEKSSGNAFYDQVAVRAIRNSSPLPPLPSGFPGSEQRFRIQFRLQD